MASSSLILNLIVRDQGASGVLGGVSKKVLGLGAAAGGLGAVLGGAIKGAASFDQTVRQIGAATGEAGAGLKDLSNLAMKMGADTSFSAKQAADAMLELAKGGLTAAEIKGGVLASTLTLAAAGSLELGDAATFMTNGLKAFGLEAKDAGKVAAAFAGGANASTASVESLGQALTQVGPSAKQAGLSIQETVAALAAFDNAGLKGSDAGTSLKTMLLNLVPTTDKAAAAMNEYGISLTDAQGNFKSLRDISEILKTKLGGLSAEQQQVALKTMFGNDAFRAAYILMGLGAQGMDQYTRATSDMAAAQNMAAVNTSGAAGATEQLKGSVETLSLKIGTALLPAYERAARGATGLVNSIGGQFDKLLASGVLGRVGEQISTGWDKLDLSGLGARFTEGAEAWAGDVLAGMKKGFKSGDWSDLGDTIGTGIASGLTTAGNLAASLAQLLGRVVQEIDWMSLSVEIGKQVPTLLVGLATGLLSFDLGGLLSGLADHWKETLLGIFVLATGGLGKALGPILGKIPLAGRFLAWALSGMEKASAALVGAMDNFLGGLARGLFSGLSRIIPEGAGLFGSLINIVRTNLGIGLATLRASMSKLADDALGALQGLPARAGAAMAALPGAVLASLAGLTGMVTGAFGNAADLLYDVGRQIVQGLWSGIESMGGWLKDKLTGWVPDAVKNPVKAALGIFSPSKVFMGIGEEIPAGMAIGIEGNLGVASAAMRAMGEDIAKAGNAIPRLMDDGPGGWGMWDARRQGNGQGRSFFRDKQGREYAPLRGEGDQGPGFWDAATMGNGQGQSFFRDFEGQVHMLGRAADALASSIPRLQSEGGPGWGLWDAKTMGNGQGESFFQDMLGRSYRPLQGEGDMGPGFWDAATMGNGQGRSYFRDYEGRTWDLGENGVAPEGDRPMAGTAGGSDAGQLRGLLEEIAAGQRAVVAALNRGMSVQLDGRELNRNRGRAGDGFAATHVPAGGRR